MTTIFQHGAQETCAADKPPLVRIGGEGAESRGGARSTEGSVGGARLGTFDAAAASAFAAAGARG
jgi:hypothetical protein